MLDYPYRENMGAVGPYDTPDRALERWMHGTGDAGDADATDQAITQRVAMLLEEANAAGQAGDFEAALDRAQEALELMPDHPDALRYELLSLVALEEWEDAFELLQEQRARLLQTVSETQLASLEAEVRAMVEALPDAAEGAAAAAAKAPNYLWWGAAAAVAYWVFKD
jgi:tetratricopeptide (TPR) repeat protein